MGLGRSCTEARVDWDPCPPALRLSHCPHATEPWRSHSCGRELAGRCWVAWKHLFLGASREEEALVTAHRPEPPPHLLLQVGSPPSPTPERQLGKSGHPDGPGSLVNTGAKALPGPPKPTARPEGAEKASPCLPRTLSQVTLAPEAWKG